MKAPLGREKYLSVGLTLFIFLFIGVLVWEWSQGMRLQRELFKMRDIPVVAVKPLNILPEFVLPTEEAGFPELVSRSLFSINRRSSATANKGGVATMKKGQFILVGVLITPQRSSAQLRDVQTNKAETVALKGVVRGMTVGEIGPSLVVLRQGTETEELFLNVQTGPRSAMPARTPAQPPPAPAAVVNAAPSPNVTASAPAPAAAITAVAPMPERSASSVAAPSLGPKK